VNEEILVELRAVAEAFKGLSENFVVVGGVATALFDFHAKADRETNVRTFFTQDIDVAIAGKVEVADDEVRERFERIGYRQELVPVRDCSTALTKYVKGTGVSEFEVEFLVPLMGKERDRWDRLKAVEKVADGIVAQQLRFLDILIVDPETVELPDSGGLEISVPNPGNYLVHKFLTLPRRDSPAQREKDSFYILDVLNRFADNHEYLAKEVSRVVRQHKPAQRFLTDFREFYGSVAAEGIVLLMTEYRRSYTGKFPLTAE